MSIEFSWDSVRNNLIKKYSDAEPYIFLNIKERNFTNFKGINYIKVKEVGENLHIFVMYSSVFSKIIIVYDIYPSLTIVLYSLLI